MTVAVDDRHLDATDSAAELAADARAGLRARPKTLPPRWFYDARGSELFERITELPEYYPTRCERAILEAHASDIARVAPAETVIELGSGSSTKTQLLLDAWHATGSLRRLVTVDVSTSALIDAAGPLGERYPDVELRPVRADFTRHLDHLDTTGRTALLFLGSTIGNLDPAQRHAFFTSARDVLSDGDVLLLGADLVKSRSILIPAYDDAGGVTAAFDLNLLHVLNRELDGDLPVDVFRHEARWNADDERIEMWLRASRAVDARLALIDVDVHFDAGEGMLTEISSKFRRDGLTAELAAAGFTVQAWWTDPQQRFSLSLSR